MEQSELSITINNVTYQRSEMDTDLERDVFDAILLATAEERKLNIRMLGIQFQRNGMCNTLVGLRNGEANAEDLAEDTAQEETDEVDNTES
jgi:hypothetical protein|tara:strand:+ start:9044 stop:9316 length:273 start_codon:yes stop_codon:yes gene_type:complete